MAKSTGPVSYAAGRAVDLKTGRAVSPSGDLGKKVQAPMPKGKGGKKC